MILDCADLQSHDHRLALRTNPLDTCMHMQLRKFTCHIKLVSIVIYRVHGLGPETNTALIRRVYFGLLLW